MDTLPPLMPVAMRRQQLHGRPASVKQVVGETSCGDASGKSKIDFSPPFVPGDICADSASSPACVIGTCRYLNDIAPQRQCRGYVWSDAEQVPTHNILLLTLEHVFMSMPVVGGQDFARLSMDTCGSGRSGLLLAQSTAIRYGNCNTDLDSNLQIHTSARHQRFFSDIDTSTANQLTVSRKRPLAILEPLGMQASDRFTAPAGPHPRAKPHLQFRKDGTPHRNME